VTSQHQLRVRLTLPPDIHAKLAALPPGLRSQVVSSVLVSVVHCLDLTRVATAITELRRLGNLLNQALHYTYRGGNFNAARVTAVLDFIDRLRAPYRRRR
jgi:hypothetical protein